jgi:hypothetical protein
MNGPTGVSPMRAAAPAGRLSDGSPAAPGHDHAWGLVRFELVDDRPMVDQRCEACGAVRRYRAWDRSWTPGEDEVRR